MALKALLKKSEYDALPDVIKEHYKVDGNNYTLDTDAGSDYKVKLDEFRENNIKLLKEQDDLKALVKKFEGIDPEAAREAATKLLELEEEALKNSGQIDELLEKRTERMKADFDNRYIALETAHTELQSKSKITENMLHGKMVEAKIAQAVGAIGAVRKGAMPDILARASSVWRLDKDLNLVAMKGENPIIGTDGKAPLTPEEYATQLLQEAPFFFEGSSGSGSGGSDDKGGSGGKSIAAGDKTAFGQNLEAIAKGEVQVAS